MIEAPPPALWLPPQPAIVRAADKALTNPGFLPRLQRRQAVKELIRNGRLSVEDAKNAIAFLLVAPPFMKAGGAVAATVSFGSVVERTDTTATYTISGMAIGTASPTRHVVVAIAHYNGSADMVSSVTVAGHSCSLLVRQNGFASRNVFFYITNAPITSGTTATVVVAYPSGSNSGTLVATYGVYDLLSNTAVDTQVSSTDAATMNLTVSAGGVALGGAYAWRFQSFTITGLTEDVDQGLNETNTFTSAAFGHATTTASGTLGISFDATVASAFGQCCVSLR